MKTKGSSQQQLLFKIFGTFGCAASGVNKSCGDVKFEIFWWVCGVRVRVAAFGRCKLDLQLKSDKTLKL